MADVDVDALSLDWVLGCSSSCNSGVHALNDSTLYYATGNNGIVYDVINKTQILLRGHVSGCQFEHSLIVPSFVAPLELSRQIKLGVYCDLIV
jgi:hypothetical protein